MEDILNQTALGFVLTWIVVCACAGIIANNKNRMWALWIIFTAIFPIVILILMALPTICPGDRRTAGVESGPMATKLKTKPNDYTGN